MALDEILNDIKVERKKYEKEVLRKGIGFAREISELIRIETHKLVEIMKFSKENPDEADRLAELIVAKRFKIDKMAGNICKILNSERNMERVVRENVIECPNCSHDAYEIDFNRITWGQGKYACPYCKKNWDENPGVSGDKYEEVVDPGEDEYTFKDFSIDEYKKYLANDNSGFKPIINEAMFGSKDKTLEFFRGAYAEEINEWVDVRQLPTTNKGSLLVKTSGWKCDPENIKSARLENIKNKKKSYSEHIKAVYGAKSFTVPKRIAGNVKNV